MTFLDTNILVYSIDLRDARKQSVARSIVFAAKDSGRYLLSAQVLNEFANVALRKLGQTREQTLAMVRKFGAIRSTPVLPEWTTRALEISVQYDIQFFDSLLLAAAEANGCDEILTEDLADGQTYCGVRAVNPFK